jgi:hypothetical protein
LQVPVAASHGQGKPGRHYGTMVGMRTALPFALLTVAACTSATTSKQDASKLYGATSSAIMAAQAKAVASTEGSNIDYTGPCDSEGSYHVHGLNDASGFDLQVTFTDCVALDRTALDGDLHYSSSTTAGTLTGSMSWSDKMTTASCSLDLRFALSGGRATYAGTVCGYDIGSF